MFFTKEQISEITKNQLQAQLTYFNAITEDIFEKVDQVVKLNDVAAKSMLSNQQTNASQLFSANGFQDMLNTIGQQMAATPEKANGYIRQVSEILAEGKTLSPQASPSNPVFSQGEGGAAADSAANFQNDLPPHTASGINDAIKKNQSNKSEKNVRQAANEIEKHLNLASSHLMENVEGHNEPVNAHIVLPA